MTVQSASVDPAMPATHGRESRMNTVLVGVDGSDSSRRAMAFACERARQLDLELLVVHVIPWSPYSFNTPTENEYRHAQKQFEIDAAQDQVVKPARALAEEAGVPVEGLVRHGDPIDLLLDLATSKDVSHIVVAAPETAGCAVSSSAAPPAISCSSRPSQ